MKARYYQSEAVESLLNFLINNDTGNPIVDTPTGSGKSVILALFIYKVLQSYPSTRIMVLSHVKELVEQDARAILRVWPDAPIGVFSAGLGMKSQGQITVAGIQSVWKMPVSFSPIDLVIIDECHLISKKSNTTYQQFIEGLKKHNPGLRIIGLSATPYRMDSGLLTQGKDRLFTDIVYSVNVADLIAQGYLSPLISKSGLTKADLSNLKTRGGEFIPAELAERMDKPELVAGAIAEVLAYGQDRKAWLLFCSGVQHAEHVAEALRHNGIPTATISGDTPARQRDYLINEFKAGRLRALTNADVLTTGFDYPQIDLIAMLRPTKSTGLYVQIVGRGLRPVYAQGYPLDNVEERLTAMANGSKANCLVLDFANNVAQHGPIDCIKIKPKAEKKEDQISVAPVKECPSCHSLLHASLAICPHCGHEFPRNASHQAEADDAPLLSSQVKAKTYEVMAANYRRYQKPGKPATLLAEYQIGDMLSFSEYVPIEDPRPFVRKHAVQWFFDRRMTCPENVEQALTLAIPAPKTITVIPDGKYQRITQASFQ